MSIRERAEKITDKLIEDDSITLVNDEDRGDGRFTLVFCGTHLAKIHDDLFHDMCSFFSNYDNCALKKHTTDGEVFHFVMVHLDRKESNEVMDRIVHWYTESGVDI